MEIQIVIKSLKDSLVKFPDHKSASVQSRVLQLLTILSPPKEEPKPESVLFVKKDLLAEKNTVRKNVTHNHKQSVKTK